MNLDMLKKDLVRFSRMLAEKKLVVSSGGNISFIYDDKVYITSTGVALDEISEDDLAVLDLNGRVINDLKPSKEAGMHIEIYKKKDVRAIIHAHPFYSTILASHRKIKESKDIPHFTPGYTVKVGMIGLVGYYRPGSKELSEAVSKEILLYNGVLLKNHGVIVAADNFRKAFNLIEDIEVNARMFLEYGNIMEPLNYDEVEFLLGK